MHTDVNGPACTNKDRWDVPARPCRSLSSATMRPIMSIPILDLKRARQRIASELEERWARILEENSYVLGPEVRDFEK